MGLTERAADGHQLALKLRDRSATGVELRKVQAQYEVLTLILPPRLDVQPLKPRAMSIIGRHPM